MQEKIKEQYKSGFDSSPIEITQPEIEFLIKHECECSWCGDSIFGMSDYPLLLTDDNEVVCECCYDRNFREICPICEEYYDTYKGGSEYEVIIETDERDYQRKPGIYHNGHLVLPIRINFLKSIDVGSGFQEVYSADICPECVDILVRKSNYIKTQGHGTPIILLKRYENHSFFSRYTPEQLKLSRQNLIHRRITYRGLIERANHIAEYGKLGRCKGLSHE